MKRKSVLLSLSLFLLFSICMGIFACGNPLKTLSPPQNLQEKNRVLTWEALDNATGYVLFLNGQEYELTENRFELYSFTTAGDFKAKIMAMGNGKAYGDSSWSEITFTLEEPIEHGYDEAGWEYTFLVDECGYEVSKGNADLEGEVVIPDYFEDFPVVRLARGAFSYYLDLVEAFNAGLCGLPPAPNPYTGLLCNVTTTSLKLPSRLRSIGELALSFMLKIEELEIPETVTEFDSMSFEGCLNLKRVNIPEGITTIPSFCFKETGLEELVLPNGLETIKHAAFQNPVESPGLSQSYHVPSDLTSVVIPDTVKNIETLAFAGRGNLRNVTMSNNIEVVGKTAFDDTAWYNAQPDGILYFRNNEVLYTYKGEMPEHTELIIPSSVKVISRYAFYHQDNLEKVFIPDGVKLQSAAFFYCRSLKEVRLPADLEEIPGNTFSHTDLQSITIPEKVTRIGEDAFSGCKNLKEVVFNEKLERIEDGAFSQCSSLISIILPSSLQSIGDSVFQKCVFTSIIIPTSVKNIGSLAFYSCDSLTEIIFKNAKGWVATKYSVDLNELPYIQLSAEELSSPTTAAQLLKTTYSFYNLTRE